MAAHWNGQLLDEYFAYADARVQTRPHFSLPWTTTTPDGVDWSVKWIVPRQIDLDSGLAISAKGKQWIFAAAAVPLLRMLQAKGTCSIRELQRCELSPQVVVSFVGEMIEGGLVTVVPNVLL